VSASPPISRTRPKSTTNGVSVPSSFVSTMMLAGLMSRWMRPIRWAAWTASAACRMISTFCSSDIPAAAALRARPSMNCMAM